MKSLFLPLAVASLVCTQIAGRCQIVTDSVNYNYQFEGSEHSGEWTVTGTTGGIGAVEVVDGAMKVDGTAFPIVNLATAFPTAINSGTYELKLDFMMNNVGGDGANQNFDRRISLSKDSTSGTSLTYLRVVREGAFNYIYSYNGAFGGTGTGFANAVKTQVAYGTWYQVTQTVKVAEQSWSWSIKNIDTGDILYSSGDLGFFKDYNEINSLEFPMNGSGTNAGRGLFYVDNISIASVPEASSMSMAALGVTVIGGICWKMRKRTER